MTFGRGRCRSALFSGALSLGLTLAPLSALVYADEASSTVHVVIEGETLSQIANSAGVDQATLVKSNGLEDANVLAVGQSLKIPSTGAAPQATTRDGAPASSASPVVGANRTYTIADGDTLSSIAQRFSTTSAWLVDANKLDDANHVVAGGQLMVPSAGPVTAPAPSTDQNQAPPAKRSLLVSYTVQPGETLNQIARQFQLKADDIAQASGLTDTNRLAVGTVLKVPRTGREHVVQPGETLRDIALVEKVDLGTLIDFNTLENPELIRVGQVVLVPARTGQPAASAAAQSSAAVQPTSVPTSAPTQPPAVQTAAAVTPRPSPSAPAAVATPTAKASPGPKAVAPVLVVSPPKGAPTDGLAGAGLKLLGSPYVWGGSTPSGFDCSGFVWYVAKAIGKPLSRGMFGEYNGGSHPARDGLKPGDLVFFQNTYSTGLSHTGIYIGNNQFVHAVDERSGVTISNLTSPYWSSRWFGATRLP